MHCPPAVDVSVPEEIIVQSRSAGVLTASPTDDPPGQVNLAKPRTRTEESLAGILAGILQVDDIPANRHFFNDLGADSLVMAQFCARVRKQPDLPSVSMKDVYQHPTISALTAALAPAPSASATAQVQDRLAEVLSGVLDVEHVP